MVTTPVTLPAMSQAFRAETMVISQPTGGALVLHIGTESILVTEQFAEVTTMLTLLAIVGPGNMNITLVDVVPAAIVVPFTITSKRAAGSSVLKTTAPVAFTPSQAMGVATSCTEQVPGGMLVVHVGS